MQRVEVKDQPVQLVAEWRRAMEVEGTVELENHNAQTVSLNQLSIQLVPGDSMANGQMAHTTVNDDGTFILKGVLPGTWRVQLLGPRLFLKSAWLGTEEITDQPIDLTGGVAGQLRLVVSTNTATIQGTAPVGKNVTTQRAEGGTWSVQVDPGEICAGRFGAREVSPDDHRSFYADAGRPRNRGHRRGRRDGDRRSQKLTSDDDNLETVRNRLRTTLLPSFAGAGGPNSAAGRYNL